MLDQLKAWFLVSGSKINTGEPRGVNPRIVRRPGIRRLTSPARLVNRDIALCEVSNRVDNNAVRPNNKDRSMGWFGSKPVMKLTNRHRHTMSVMRCACALLVTPYRLRTVNHWPTVDVPWTALRTIKPAAMPEQRKPGFRFVTRCNVNQELIGGCRSGFQLGLLGPAYKSVCNAS